MAKRKKKETITKKTKKKEETFGEELISALEDVADYKKGKISLKTTTIVLPDLPEPMARDEIQELRGDLEMSQAVFARFIGVSPATVKAWELGTNSPKGPALRLLYLALKDKKAFINAATA